MSDEFATCRDMLADRRYILSSLVPFHRDPSGQVWVGDLWHRDLMMHLEYIPDLTILAAQLPGPPEPDMLPVITGPGQRLRFVASGPVLTGRRQLPRALPRMRHVMRELLRDADVVHSGVAGWPIPPGVLLNPMTVRRKIPLIIAIESAFWRIPEGTRASLRWRIEAAATERFARWSASHAALGIYTHRSYAQSLPVRPGAVSAVTPASWIRQKDVMSVEEVAASWRDKPEQFRLLLASRLTVEKGSATALAALRQLEDQGHSLEIDIVGSGAMTKDFTRFAATSRHVRLTMLPEVAYATEFLPLLRNYHAVLVPTIGDEQPRVILDAFSQGVPVIASDTPGNCEVTTAGENAILVKRGDPADLARGLSAPDMTPARLQKMAGAARDKAFACTHEMMHRQRAALLVRALAGKMPAR